MCFVVPVCVCVVYSIVVFFSFFILIRALRFDLYGIVNSLCITFCITLLSAKRKQKSGYDHAKQNLPGIL